MPRDASNNQALSPEQFFASLEALGVGVDYAIAVSGGRDSMSLACLAAAHQKTRRVNVLALTVDHGLRAESAREAEQVASWCAALGLKHNVLQWRGEKPGAGIQAAARRARYGLLVGEAQAAGRAAN